MKITFLGTGTSQGVPVISCKCEICTSSNEKDKRLRSSILIEIDDKILVIDAGPDFRQQMLNFNICKLTAILLTHEHRDHIAGLDDIRAFNYISKKAVDVFAETRVLKAVEHEFFYAFKEDKYPGIPEMNLHEIIEEPFNIEGIKIIPIRGFHNTLPVLGFRVNDFAYLTDLNYISENELIKLQNLHTLVITSLRKKKHVSHFCFSESLDIIDFLKPKNAYLTHISHQLGLYDTVSKELPDNIYLAYDKLQVELD